MAGHGKRNEELRTIIQSSKGLSSNVLILPMKLRDRGPDPDLLLKVLMKVLHMGIFIYIVLQLHVSDEKCPRNLGVMKNSLELMGG